MSQLSDSPSNPVLLERYRQLADVHDEMLGVDQQPREHWRQFLAAMKSLGEDEVGRRWDATKRLLYENGIAHALAGMRSKSDPPRPWQLDPIPLLLEGKEWKQLSKALAQRARLLNALLADLYGERSVIKRGLLPAQVLFTHPGYLRSMHGYKPNDDCFLHFYAADLARDERGQWVALSDRTEAPSGLGFALENRIALSRFLPGVMHQCSVQRLAPFFVTLKDTLARLAPSRAQHPNVVLLTQGPHNNPNYFEDSYLARYLGYTLVEGGDLCVRDEHVLLKTLSGLTPVDVILRRPNSLDCDPLELNGAARFGVTGLAQAIRAGHVLVANTLGSGVIESPIFTPFLEKLCPELLGEPLQLASAPTHWCGDPASQQMVLDDMDAFFFMPAFRTRGWQRRLSNDLNKMPKAELADRIRSAGSSYVAQRRMSRSTTPMLTQKNPRPAHIALRAYLTYGEGEYTALPGGLTRVSVNSDPLEISILAGESSKDAWVISNEPVSSISLQELSTQPAIRRRAADFPSRAAENFFWLGRYVARAEAAARLLRSICTRLCDETDSEEFAELPPLLRALASQGRIEPGFVVEGMRDHLPALERSLPGMVLDRNSSHSLRVVIDGLYRTGSIVRDRLSGDTWRIIHKIAEEFRSPSSKSTTAFDLLAMLDHLQIDLSALKGLILDGMTRTPAWQFIEIGRRLEFALQSAILINNTLAKPEAVTGPLLEAVLETADSLMTYRSRYFANLQLPGVLDLLLTDESNPRSIAFQLKKISDHVAGLPRDESEPALLPHEKSATNLLHRLRMTDVNAISTDPKEAEQLTKLLAFLEEELPNLSDHICRHFFVQVDAVRLLSSRQTRVQTGGDPQ